MCDYKTTTDRHHLHHLYSNNDLLVCFIELSSFELDLETKKKKKKYARICAWHLRRA